MKTISEFTGPTARAINEAIEAELQAFAKKHGVTIKTRGGSFNAKSFTCKLEVTVNAADGSSRPKEAIDFEEYAGVFGLKASYLGRSFQHNGKTFVVEGLKMGARKNNIVVRLVGATDRKRFVVPAHVVAASLAEKKVR
jgi:hypothetical protein